MSTEVHNVQPQATPTAAATATPEPKKLEGEALKEAILRQVDYYFSRQNLVNDAYLVSQMRKDAKGHFVSLKTIAAFSKVKTLSEDIALITEVVRSSKNVTVEELAGDVVLRPTQIQLTTRNTVIVRDIPSNTDAETVKALFTAVVTPSAVKSEIGNNWFVSFESEADAIQALEHIRKQTFEGKPISARIKSENLVKSSAAPVVHTEVPVDPSSAPFFPSYSQRTNWNRNAAAHNPYAPQWDFNAAGFVPGTEFRPKRAFNGARRGGIATGAQPRGRKDSVTHPTKKATSENAVATASQPNARQQQKVQGNEQQKKKTTEKKRGKGQGQKASPSLSANDFPPLPSSKGGEQKPAYETPFKKYSKQEIVDVVSALGSGAAPELPTDCPAVLQTPNTDIELTKPLPKDGESKTEGTFKSFAEAAITAKDIKAPEAPKARRGSKRQVVAAAANTGANQGGKRNNRSSNATATSGSSTAQPSESAQAEASTDAPATSEEEFKEVKRKGRAPRKQKAEAATEVAEGAADTTETDAADKQKNGKNRQRRSDKVNVAPDYDSQQADGKKGTTYADIVAAKKAAAEKAAAEKAAAEKAAGATTDAAASAPVTGEAAAAATPAEASK